MMRSFKACTNKNVEQTYKQTPILESQLTVSPGSAIGPPPECHHCDNTAFRRRLRVYKVYPLYIILRKLIIVIVTKSN